MAFCVRFPLLGILHFLGHQVCPHGPNGRRLFPEISLVLHDRLAIGPEIGDDADFGKFRLIREFRARIMEELELRARSGLVRSKRTCQRAILFRPRMILLDYMR